MGKEMEPLAAQLDDAAANFEVAQRDLFKAAGNLIRKHAGISAGRPVNAARARRSVLLLHRETHRFGEGERWQASKKRCPSPARFSPTKVGRVDRRVGIMNINVRSRQSLSGGIPPLDDRLAARRRLPAKRSASPLDGQESGEKSPATGQKALIDIDDAAPLRRRGRLGIDTMEPPARQGGDFDDDASVLGLAGYDHDAVRIIMAAQLRLRLLRMRRQTPDVRDRARRIARARDVLLRTAVQLQHSPASPR